MGIRLVGDRLMFKKALQELQKHARMVKRSKAIWYVATGALLRAAAAFASRVCLLSHSSLASHASSPNLSRQANGMYEDVRNVHIRRLSIDTQN